MKIEIEGQYTNPYRNATEDKLLIVEVGEDKYAIQIGEEVIEISKKDIELRFPGL